MLRLVTDPGRGGQPLHSAGVIQHRVILLSKKQGGLFVLARP
ncbi:hypothetical protein SL1157_2299 [Ruegeria lacuscaerulensis ITI-1157]|nr:hypothetical protein SL1157_2299 [Ruegeria lacuscaerulensis ITI-1157]